MTGNLICDFPLFSRLRGGQAKPKERSMRPMITPMMKLLAAAAIALGLAAAGPVLAQDPPRIVIGSAVIEPMPIAVPTFIDEGGAGDFAREISRVVISDLEGQPDHQL